MKIFFFLFLGQTRSLMNNLEDVFAPEKIRTLPSLFRMCLYNMIHGNLLSEVLRRHGILLLSMKRVWKEEMDGFEGMKGMA